MIECNVIRCGYVIYLDRKLMVIVIIVIIIIVILIIFVVRLFK